MGLDYVPTAADTDRWDGLMSSWLLALEAEAKSLRTLDNYRYAPTQLGDWLAGQGLPERVETLTPDLVRRWLAEVGRTRSAATARSRYGGLRSFLGWCLAEGELDTDPMANVTAPAVVTPEVQMLSTDQLRALLKSCEGREFVDLRDRALLLLFADTGARLSGITNMRETDVDLRDRTARLTMKGGRVIRVPFGATTATALDRYLRAKRRQRYGERDWLWLSATNKGRLTPNGVYQMARRRSAKLGFHLHPHMMRHGFADAWLSAGGSEGDLMEIAGWQSRQMLARYGAARRQERAREAHRRLSPMDSL